MRKEAQQKPAGPRCGKCKKLLDKRHKWYGDKRNPHVWFHESCYFEE